MIFLENEKEIMTSDDGTVVLTNYRVQYTQQDRFISIMLDKISAIQFVYRSNLYALYLGVFVGILSIIAGAAEMGQLFIIGLLVAAILLLYYFFSRHHVVAIVSDSGTSLDFYTKGANRSSLMKFVNAVEREKFIYSKKLHSFKEN